MSVQINTVVIDDEAVLAEYLKDVLLGHGLVVYTAVSGTEGLELIEKIRPELVLLDIGLPDIDGRSLCQKIKNDFPDTKVIMITGHGTTAEIAEGLNLGADDYLPKPIDENELMARIKARLRKTEFFQTTLQTNDLLLNSETHEVSRANRKIELSPQEFKLLQYLMTNKNKVVSRDMILSRIWEGNPDIETRIVDVYLGYLRKKIDFKKPQLLHTVRGFGYMLKEPNEVKPPPKS